MSFTPKFRTPKEYDDKVFQPILKRIYDDINTVDRKVVDLDSDLRPNILRLERQAEEAPLVTLFKAEFYQYESGGDQYAQGRIIPVSGEQAANQFRARHQANGNIEEGDAWTTLGAGDWVDDSAYPREGYYEYNTQFEPAARDEPLVTMQLQVRHTGNRNVWLDETHTFDINRTPSLRQFKVSVGNFNYSTEKWRIYLTWEGDEDFGSIGIGYGTTPYDSDDANVTDADTGDVHDNNRSNSGSFLFEADPATQYFFVARAYSDVGGGGDAGVQVYRDDVFTPPNLSTGDYLNDNAITAQMLVNSAVRASVNIQMSLGSSPSDSVDYSGTIQYADQGTPYTMAPSTQTIDMSSSSDLWYFYFDPTTDANSLQATTSAATAKSITDRRLLVGIGKKASSATERAFFVVTSDEPVITAPVINVAQLSALNADVGVLTAGVIKNTDYDTSGGVYLDLTTEGLMLTAPSSEPGGTDPQSITWLDGSTEILKLFAWMNGIFPLSVVGHQGGSGALIMDSGWDIQIDADNDLLVNVTNEIKVEATTIFQDELTIDVENSGGVITINDATTDPTAGNKLYAKGGNLYWDGTQLN